MNSLWRVDELRGQRTPVVSTSPGRRDLGTHVGPSPIAWITVVPRGAGTDSTSGTVGVEVGSGAGGTSPPGAPRGSCPPRPGVSCAWWARGSRAAGSSRAIAGLGSAGAGPEAGRVDVIVEGQRSLDPPSAHGRDVDPIHQRHPSFSCRQQ